MIQEQTGVYLPRSYPQIGQNNSGTPPYNPFGNPFVPPYSIREPTDPIKICDPELPSIGRPFKDYIWC